MEKETIRISLDDFYSLLKWSARNGELYSTTKELDRYIQAEMEVYFGWEKATNYFKTKK